MNQYNRREVVKRAGMAGAALLLPAAAQSVVSPLRVGGRDVELQLAPVGAHTVRITLSAVKNEQVQPVPDDGSLARASWGPAIAKLRGVAAPQSFNCGELRVQFTPSPLSFKIETVKGDPVQQLTIDPDTGVLEFTTGSPPLLGLGEGGPQFDRRGSTDRMRSGQGGYQLRTHGGRVPIPWIIGTAGWA